MSLLLLLTYSKVHRTIYISLLKGGIYMSKTRRQDRWNERNGYISKSYKLHSDLVKEFAEACNIAGISQKRQLEKMMSEFISDVKNKEALR